MQHRIGTALACLHISAAIYLLVAALLLALSFVEGGTGQDVVMGRILVVGFCLGLIVGIELVALGLNRRKYWAWIVGLCIFGLYLPSLFLPLGAAGLWGLLDTRSRREFGIQ